MRSTAEIKDSISDLRSDLDAMIQASERENRDFTSKEASQADAILSKIETEKAALDVATKLDKERQERNAGRFSDMIADLDPADDHKPHRASASWNRDSRGRGFAILNKAQRASDVFKPQAENEFGHYILAKLFGANGSTPRSVKAVLSTNDNSLGGFMVPGQLSSEVIDLARARSVLSQAGMRTILMDSDSLTVPKLESDVTVATKSENAAFTASDVTFGARQFNTYTAGALVKLSRELAEDAPGLLAEQLTAFMGSKMAEQVDAWGLNGTASAQPLGILNRTEIDDTGTIGAIDWLDVAAAATAIRNANHEPNAAILNTEIYSDLFNAQTGDGTNASRGWLNAPPTLANVSFQQTTNCPLAKLIVGDFTKYAMGMRTGAMVEMTTQAGEAFERHQVWVKITMRFDFQTLDDSAFHILTGITS